MNKYIDAEKLIAEIKRRMESHRKASADGYIIDPNRLDEDEDILSFVTSLQQEQPKVDLDADIEMEWDSFNKHLNKFGEESEEVVWLNWLSFVDIANYFYNLGLNARKENEK